MTLSAGNKVVWSDITALFTSMNTYLSKAGYSKITPTGGVGVKIVNTPAQQLKTGLTTLSGHTNIKGKITPGNVVVPSPGSLLKPLPFVNAKTEIDKLASINIGFNPFSSCFSFFDCFFDCGFSSNSGFSTDTGNFSFCTGFTSNNAAIGYSSNYGDSCSGFNGLTSDGCSYGDAVLSNCPSFGSCPAFGGCLHF